MVRTATLYASRFQGLIVCALMCLLPASVPAARANSAVSFIIGREIQDVDIPDVEF